MATLCTCCQEEKNIYCHEPCVTCRFSFHAFSRQWGGERKKQRETEVICLRGTGRGEGDESRRRPARNETASEREREISTDGESEAVEIPLTDLRVSPSPKCRSDADAPVRARPRVSGCGVTRAKATEDERASAGLVEASFSHPPTPPPRGRRDERGANGRLAESPSPFWSWERATRFLSADKDVPICVSLSFADDESMGKWVRSLQCTNPRVALRPERAQKPRLVSTPEATAPARPLLLCLLSASVFHCGVFREHGALNNLCDKWVLL